MTDIYSLEEKISNIRKVVKNLTGDPYSTFDFKPSLLKEISSSSSRSSQSSLDNFLGKPKPSQEIQISRTLDYTKNSSFNHSPRLKNKSSSFLSEEISSLKYPDKENLDFIALLEHEKENIKKLEQRIFQKDEIISSMNLRQQALLDELAGLKRQSSLEQADCKLLISNLQEKLDKYSSQINYMQSRPTPDFKSQSEEEFLAKIAYLERQIIDQGALIEEINLKNTKIKQDQSLIAELKQLVEKKDKNLIDLINENKELQSKITDLNGPKKDSRMEFREFKLKEEVNRLKQVNEELFEKYKQIEKRGFVETFRDRSAAKERTGTRDVSTGNRRSCSSKKEIHEVAEVLQCAVGEIVQTVKKLQKSKKLEERLARLIQDLSKNPEKTKAKDIWNCIKKLVEEYMAIKKGDKNLIGKICKLLGVKESEAYEEVKKVCEERKKVNSLFEKIKKMLCLSPHAALRDIEDTIDEKV